MDTPAMEFPDPLGFSATAIERVERLIAEVGNAELKLRIYVSGGGCSGFQYGFAFEENANEDDIRIRRGAVTLLVDPVSLQYLAGADVDFEDSLEGARFVIHNPNATSTCGCGSSFTV
ncbi:iron-sulfur cluster insertion protein ErpA [Niveibacterium terrae]|uniref:iron-sulfur cluster insertion protein ErpA n=1 Tax=Niveibacterium terrae TaxID=3373598 RepID=UPI003A900EED